MLKRNRKPILAIAGSAFAATLVLSSVAHADTNPFVAEAFDGGYLLAAQDAEGKCGEGKCGEDNSDKDAEGKCGSDNGKDAESKDAEGKCGEGKCGSVA